MDDFVIGLLAGIVLLDLIRRRQSKLGRLKSERDAAYRPQTIQLRTERTPVEVVQASIIAQRKISRFWFKIYILIFVFVWVFVEGLYSKQTGDGLTQLILMHLYRAFREAVSSLS